MTAINHNDPDETIKPLAEDNDPPFTPADDVADQAVEPTDLITDLDADEAYQEGEASAAGTDQLPKHDSGVANYNPDEDEDIAL